MLEEPRILFPEQKINNWRITQEIYKKGTKVDSDGLGSLVVAEEDIVFNAMFEDGSCWDSNAPFCLHSRKKLVNHFSGSVFIIGLGLFSSYHFLDKCKEIYVIEKSKEVIDMIWPYFEHDKRVKLIHGDIFEKAERGRRFDHIFCDILGFYPVVVTGEKRDILNAMLGPITSDLVYWEESNA